MEQWQEFEQKWARIVAKSWTDPAFQLQLLNDPREVMKANGLDLPEEYEVKVYLGGRRASVELPLPRRPADFSEKSLAASAENDVGICCSCCCSC